MKEECFENLVCKYYDKLYQYSYTLSGNRDEALDLVHDVVLTALIKQDLFTPGSYFQAWIRRILFNTYINNKKKKATRNAHNHNTQRKSHFASDNHDGLEVLDMYDSIEKLPTKTYCVLQLYLQGYKYHEISDKLNIPEGTVKSRLWKARQELKTILL